MARYLVDSPYKVERGIPIPGIETNNHKYPFQLLKIGESFAVPFNGVCEYRVKCRLNSSANYHQQGTFKRFTTRIDRKKKCYRVWRIQ